MTVNEFWAAKIAEAEAAGGIICFLAEEIPAAGNAMHALPTGDTGKGACITLAGDLVELRTAVRKAS